MAEPITESSTPLLDHEKIHSLPLDPSRTKTLIMKGGGVKGLAFAGAVEVLEENGYTFDTYVGTSAGAVAAVLFGVKYSAKEIMHVLYEQPFNKFLDAPIWKAFVNLIFRGGLFPGDVLTDWIKVALTKKLRKDHKTPPTPNWSPTLADIQKYTQKRIIVFASHLLLGSIVYDSQKKRKKTYAAEAARISASIPGVFIPVYENRHPIFDGGLLNNFPIKSYLEERGRLKYEEGTKIVIEDFIALYVYDGDNSSSKRWFSQILDIMLTRDEAKNQEEHGERIVFINTDPIRSWDFHLSDAEKNYLIEVGRHAALGFISSHFSMKKDYDLSSFEIDIKDKLDKSRNEITELRNKVDSDRSKRRIRNKPKRWLGYSLLALIFCSPVMLASIPIAILWAKTVVLDDVYKIDNQIKFEDTYVDGNAKLKRIVTSSESRSKKEIESFADGHGKTWLDNRFIFNSAFEFIITNQSSPSARIIIWDGVYKEGDDRIFKLEATSNAVGNESEHSVLNYALFVETKNWLSRNNDWSIVKECNPNIFTPPNDPKLEIAINPSECLKKNAHVRIVELAIHPNVFKYDEVIPWFLFAHRATHPQTSEASYLFLTQDHENVHYLYKQVYVLKDKTYFNNLELPINKGLCTPESWDRARKMVQFLEDIKDKYNEKNPGSLKIIEAILVQANIELVKSNDAECRTPLLQFDAEETSKYKINEENLILFAEAKSKVLSSIDSGDILH